MQSGCAPCSASRAGAKTSPWHPLLLEPELGTSVGTQKKPQHVSSQRGGIGPHKPPGDRLAFHRGLITGRQELLFAGTLTQLCQLLGESALLHQTHQQTQHCHLLSCSDLF